MFAAGDPLFAEGVDFGVVMIVVLKTVVVFGFLMTATALMIWFERKLVGDFQNRIGPNRAGPFGILQSAADGIKLFFKENLLPERGDHRVYRLAPYITVLPAFLTFSVIPMGGSFSGGDVGTVHIFGHDTFLQLADPPIGVLFVLAMSSIAVYGVMLAGWSSGSKYPLLGAVRASGQMISYEAALGLSLAAVVLVSQTLSTHDIVMWQAGPGRGDLIPNWNLIVTGVVPFVIFLIAGTAELERPPFDLLEAEQELVAGFATEYSSVRFTYFFLASFMNVITMSAIIVTLFLGGPAGPAFFGPEWVWGFVWFFAKLLVLLYTFVWFRATLPRFRYDQLMDLGWKVMIPLALGWLLLIAAIRVADDDSAVPAIVIGAGTVFAASVLMLAVQVGRRRRELVAGAGGGEVWS
ncbi:MAG: complex I subunit 1/NuoH family protein [Acidimicrobiales bacterium]